MAISRAQMASQLTGNRQMKKTKKMVLGGLAAAKLGAGVSPMVSLARSLRSGEPEGILKYTPIGAAMRKTRCMRKGGKIDGCAMRGKTKGRTT